MADSAIVHAKVTMKLFGAFALYGRQGQVVPIAGRRTRGLLAYLLLANGNSATRERLSGLFWGDRGEAQARSSLRQCLLELRAALAEAGLDALVATREAVRLDPEWLGSDVNALLTALSADDLASVLATINSIGSSRLLEDLDLGGSFGEWLDQTRAQIDQLLASGLAGLVERLEARHDWANVTALADAWLRRDPADEGVVAAAIRADLADGATASAQRRFVALETLLARELGVEPGKAVREALLGKESAGSPIINLPAEPLLAVMAFDNLPPDAEMEYFSEGISEEILQNVARTSSLKVIAKASSFQFRGRDKVTATIAAQLGATHLLDGSVRRSGDKVRITAALVECATQTTLWSGRFDRELSDIFAIQDEIASAVARGLQKLFAVSDDARPVDPAAYDQYLRARSLSGAPTNVEACIALLESATTLSPDFAAAWSSLAMARAIVARWNADPQEFENSRYHAVTAVDKAIALDPGAGLPLVALSLIERPSAYQIRESLLQRAVAASPYDSEVLKHSSDFAYSVGRVRECLDLALQAGEIDPLNAVISNNAAMAFADLGRIPEALIMFDQNRLRWPDFDWGIALPIMVGSFTGDWDLVDRFLTSNTHASPHYKMAYSTAMLLRAPIETQHGTIRHVAQEQLAKNGAVEIGLLQMMYYTGLHDETFDFIAKSDFETPKGGMPGGIFLSGIIFGVTNIPMRSDPRFVQLCDKLGLCDYWVTTGRWPDCAQALREQYDFRAAVHGVIAARS